MTTAREIMHPGAECIGINDNLQVAAQRMRDLGVGALPICGEDDRLHGIITDRDIVITCVASGLDPHAMTAGDLAQGTPYVADADDDMDAVLHTMQAHQIRRLPVIDNHRLVGMISEADVARNLPDEKVAEFVEAVYARS